MPSSTSSAGSARRLSLLALLTAMALAAQYLESLLPPIVPGVPVRIGLANVFTLYALAVLGRRSAGLLVLARCLLFALVTGAVSGLLYSVSGSLLSFTGMALLLPLLHRDRLSLYGLSVAGAFLFNAGQLLAGLWVVGSAILAYLPWMGLLSLPAGLATALACSLVLRRLPRPTA